MATKDNVAERYNLNIKKWGRAGWVYLTAAVLQYPDNPSPADKENFKKFFEANAWIIPCSVCKKHYAENLKKHPLTDEVLSSRRTLAEWLNTMRNEVNISSKKPTISLLEMIADYMTPVMAKSMLRDDKELQQLINIDRQKNQAYVKNMITSIAKSQYREECYNGPACVNLWWFWLIVVILVILLVLFICAIIKSACNSKPTKRPVVVYR